MPKQNSTQQQSNRLRTQYTDSVYRTEIFPLSHAASTKRSHTRYLIAYGLRFRDGMLYLGRIIPTFFLFILAKVAIIISSEFRALFQNKIILCTCTFAVHTSCRPCWNYSVFGMCFRWNTPRQRQPLLHRLVVMLRMRWKSSIKNRTCSCVSV